MGPVLACGAPMHGRPALNSGRVVYRRYAGMTDIEHAAGNERLVSARSGRLHTDHGGANDYDLKSIIRAFR